MSEATKSEKHKFRAIKGTRDILPPESALWNRVEQTARETFAAYGFQKIRLPVFEETELFARSIGSETDIVSKEMYGFEDHELRELAALRTLLVEKQPSIQDPNFFLSYELKVAEFRERLRTGLENGEVPKTPENLRVVADLGPMLDMIAGSRQGYEKTRADQHLERFNLYVGHVRRLLLVAKFGDDLTLRPEATASVCRAYIEHNMQQWPQPVKLYYIGPMFRRERPQKGRYRQFYQIGAEVLGQSDAPAIDAEVIEMLLAFFDRLGLKGATLFINSIGCRNCRPKYVEILRTALEKVRDKLGADSQRRIETNPLRVLDSKLPEEQPIIEKLPRIADYLCADCRAHFEKVQEELKLRGIRYEINWRLVRGLDYYVRTTFEITAPGLGAQDAVCGGGRYDGLVELLGGPRDIKGTGFAIGTDRLVLSLQETGKLKAEPHLDVFVAWMGEGSYPAAVRIARRLRDAGISVELPAEEMKFKKSIGLADKLGARYALIIGEDEVAKKQFALKRLADGEQRTMSESELMESLKSEGSSPDTVGSP